MLESCRHIIAGRRLIAFALALVYPSITWADGGRLQASQRIGSWDVSVFTLPTPIRAGPLDVSVLVQDAQTHGLIPDAQIIVQARSPDGSGKPIVARASHAAATNQLLQAAWLDLPRAGPWLLELVVSDNGHRSKLRVPIHVEPPLPAWQAMWPWFTLPAWPIALFLLCHIGRVRRPARTDEKPR